MDTENTNEKNNIETFNNGIENVPFSTSVLVLGILSILTCGCYGLPGLVCGIIAIIQSKRGLTAYEENKPIEWIRVHNLPDLAYFNHSQHVAVGGLDCETCHGPIKEMDVVYQYADLTMGWCINCHRDTQVNAKGNEYYDKIAA